MSCSENECNGGACSGAQSCGTACDGAQSCGNACPGAQSCGNVCSGGPSCGNVCPGAQSCGTACDGKTSCADNASACAGGCCSTAAPVVGINAGYRIGLRGWTQMLRRALPAGRGIEQVVMLAEVTAGGSGYVAGLREGDLIIAVDGVAVSGMELEAVVSMIVGPEGSRVEIVIERDTEEGPFERTFKVKRSARVADVAAMAARVRQANANRTGPVRRRVRECNFCPSLQCPGCPKLYGADGELLTAPTAVGTSSEAAPVPPEEAHYPAFVQDILRRSRAVAPPDPERDRAVNFVNARIQMHAVRRRLEEAVAQESASEAELEALVAEYETAFARYIEAEGALDNHVA